MLYNDTLLHGSANPFRFLALDETGYYLQAVQVVVHRVSPRQFACIVDRKGEVLFVTEPKASPEDAFADAEAITKLYHKGTVGT